MCGFAGIVSFSERCRIDPARAASLARELAGDLAHRGPDGQGVFQLGLEGGSEPAPHAPQAIFTHTRLAVIDPTPCSDQPFISQDGRLVLLFNGEIFNYRQLRQAMPDRQWRSAGDTETLLAAYETWGQQCVDHLEGMFAFAILDLREPGAPLLFMARDPAGEKPLFLATRIGPTGAVEGVAFASELAPLRRVGWIDLELDWQALQDYLAWGYIPERRTIHRGISKLLPGHAAAITPASVLQRRYFDPGGRHVLSGDDRWASAVTLTRQLVAQAVEKRLVSDVPIGCLLSGGVDSSVVALHMSRALQREGRKLATFSIGFDDPRYDETAYAAEVARHVGTDHHAFQAQPHLAEDLPRLATVFGEPFGDSSAIPTHYLARQTRGHVTVALSGDGGDEVFGGYDRYVAMRLGERMAALPHPVRAAMVGLAGRLGSAHPKSLRARLKRLGVSLADSPGVRYAGYMRLFSHADLVRLLPPGTASREEPGRVAGRWFDAYLRGRDVVSAAAALDRVTYLPGDLLVKLDRCSMLHALEVRAPFMDAHLLRFASTLGESGLLETRGLRAAGKRLLRDAFAHQLPPSVFSRRKMGFAVPVGEWFRGALRPMLRDVLLAGDSFAGHYFAPHMVRELLTAHDTGRAEHGQRLYALLMLELWWREARTCMDSRTVSERG